MEMVCGVGWMEEEALEKSSAADVLSRVGISV